MENQELQTVDVVPEQAESTSEAKPQTEHPLSGMVSRIIESLLWHHQEIAQTRKTIAENTQRVLDANQKARDMMKERAGHIDALWHDLGHLKDIGVPVDHNAILQQVNAIA